MGGIGKWRGYVRACGTSAAVACLAGSAAGQTPPGAPIDGTPRVTSNIRIADDRTKASVQRALIDARSRLTDANCRELFTEFTDASGRPLQDALDAVDQQPEDYLQTLLFYDGSGLPNCRPAVAATTTPGGHVVFICAASFVRVPWPDGEITIIHEMLHTLGLRENPPTSMEITRRVRMRCFDHLGRSSTR
jgi:hypothetical protein